MTDIEHINKAITVHTAWKVRLLRAMESRSFDMPIEMVRLDDQCVLGKWLRGPMMTAQDKRTPQYKLVVHCHAAFHECAARVLESALAGRIREAELMMSYGGGDYPLASSKLVRALSDWKTVSQHAPPQAHLESAASALLHKA